MCVYRLIFIAVVVAIVVVVLDDETVQNERERDRGRETVLKILKYLWEEPVARVMKIFQLNRKIHKIIIV